MCSTISLSELFHGLSITGCIIDNIEEIKLLFQAVDVERNGALDFAEVARHQN